MREKGPFSDDSTENIFSPDHWKPEDLDWPGSVCVVCGGPVMTFLCGPKGITTVDNPTCDECKRKEKR